MLQLSVEWYIFLFVVDSLGPSVDLIGWLFVPAKKRNGTAPSHSCRGNRSVARKILQSLENLKLVEKDPNTGSVVAIGIKLLRISTALYFWRSEKLAVN